MCGCVCAWCICYIKKKLLYLLLRIVFLMAKEEISQAIDQFVLLEVMLSNISVLISLATGLISSILSTKYTSICLCLVADNGKKYH